MRRKLVKQGAATMMVSLPAKWIKRHELNKGDEISIHERQNDLILSSEEKKLQPRTEINITELTETSIRTLLTNAYRLGYDKIVIRFKDKKALNTIRNTVDTRLLGFEIIKTSSDLCTIENITEPSKEQFDNLLNKVFLNIDEIFELAEQALHNKKVEFEELEGKIQQFDNFCKRVIAKNNLHNQYQLQWAFHVELIHAQRELYLMLRFLNKNRIKTDKATLDLLKHCKEIYQMLAKAYKEKSIPLLEKIHTKEKEIVYKHGYSALKKNVNSIPQHHIINAARGFYLASSPLMGTFITNP